jgi:hypothetical protein
LIRIRGHRLLDQISELQTASALLGTPNSQFSLRTSDFRYF